MDTSAAQSTGLKAKRPQIYEPLGSRGTGPNFVRGGDNVAPAILNLSPNLLGANRSAQSLFAGMQTGSGDANGVRASFVIF